MRSVTAATIWRPQASYVHMKQLSCLYCLRKKKRGKGEMSLLSTVITGASVYRGSLGLLLSKQLRLKASQLMTASILLCMWQIPVPEDHTVHCCDAIRKKHTNKAQQGQKYGCQEHPHIPRICLKPAEVTPEGLQMPWALVPCCMLQCICMSKSRSGNTMCKQM